MEKTVSEKKSQKPPKIICVTEKIQKKNFI